MQQELANLAGTEADPFLGMVVDSNVFGGWIALSLLRNRRRCLLVGTFYG